MRQPVYHPYARTLQEVVTDNRLTHQARNLYTILAGYCGDKDYCWPGIDHLAEHQGTTSRSVTNAFEELEHFGYVQRMQKGKKKVWGLRAWQPPAEWNPAESIWVVGKIASHRKGNQFPQIKNIDILPPLKEWDSRRELARLPAQI